MVIWGSPISRFSQQPPFRRIFQCMEMAVGQNLVPLVNIKIAGKWMFIPLKMVCIGIDPYPCLIPRAANCHGIHGAFNRLCHSGSSSAPSSARSMATRRQPGRTPAWRFRSFEEMCVYIYMYIYIYVYIYIYKQAFKTCKIG